MILEYIPNQAKLDGRRETIKNAIHQIAPHLTRHSTQDCAIQKTWPVAFADLSGLPPTLIHVGEQEALLDDSRILAHRMIAQGSSAELKVYTGMWHVLRIPRKRQLFFNVVSNMLTAKNEPVWHFMPRFSLSTRKNEA